MQTLRLTTSQSIFLATTTPKYHARLQFGPALKPTLNHDITKCFSSHGRKQHADEDSSRTLRESYIFERSFQPKQASLTQKLSSKNEVHIIKPHNHSRTKRGHPRSIQRITGLVVEKQSACKNNSAYEAQQSARLGESSTARGQMLYGLSGSTKDKIDENSKRRKKHKIKKISSGPNLSLLEELFPEEFGQAAARDSIAKGEEVIPRLPLVEFDDEDDLYHDAQSWKCFEDGQIERLNEKDALREWDLAVLVVSRASKSLIESDFRRLIPRGQHIDEWRGPGDILKGE